MTLSDQSITVSQMALGGGVCEGCGAPIVGKRFGALYCSNACRQRAYRARHPRNDGRGFRARRSSVTPRARSVTDSDVAT